MTIPQDSAGSPDLESLTFEEAYRRLSEMAESLEDGSVSLSDAMTRYEEGMKLVRLCNRLLDEAELKITGIRDSESAPEPPPFDDDMEVPEEDDDLPF